ncbi:MAG: gamma-glutamylcyclotransferase [Candidatus Thiodiazotropha sp. DIVDIV]
MPSAKLETVATLQRHELRFHKISKDGSGKCDAYETKNPQHSVIGVVYDISESEKQILDRKEGLGDGYEQKEVTLTTVSGENIRAITYYATNIGLELKPYHWYKNHVLTGAEENGLPAKYIEKIMNIKSVTDPKPERHESEMAIYTNK